MKILITRILDGDSPLIAWCNRNNHTLIQEPYISTETVSSSKIPHTDWIFFTSPKGVKHYLENNSIIANKIAAIGEGTAKALNNLGQNPEFIGSSTDTLNVARDFKNRIGTESVLFPIGTKSLKRVQNELDPSQVKEVIVYQTEVQTKDITEDLDIIICSSPSNAEGLKLSGIAQIPMIAFGKTTEDYLKSVLGQNKVETLSAYNDEAIIQALERLM